MAKRKVKTPVETKAFKPIVWGFETVDKSVKKPVKPEKRKLTADEVEYLRITEEGNRTT